MEQIANSWEKSSEASREEIIARNFQKMNSEMIGLLRRESMGGNAGDVEIDGKRYPCAAANAWVDRESGEIKMFGNFQEIPEEIRSSNVNICFRIAVNFFGEGRKGFFRIVNILDKETLSAFAQEVIDASAADYNSLEIVKTKKIA